MRKLLFAILFILSFCNSFATHIIGGEMRYEYLGPGVAPNSKQYKIRLLLLKGDSPVGADLITQYIVGVFNNDNGQKVPGPEVNSDWAAVEDFPGKLPVPIIVSPCIAGDTTLLYTYKRYSFIIELPDNNNGYTVAFQTFSRQYCNNINNDQGATYSCSIPGLSVLPVPQTDNSPEFKLPISVICENSHFSLDFSATDADGDSLVYNFCNAYNGGNADQGDYQNPVGPPYGSVIYTSPYNASFPMGPQVLINPNTGIISGIAPTGGKYVLCVCISVFRNGVFIGIHRKDLIVAVNGCTPLVADPNFTPVTCDGFTVNFTDNSTGNPTDYLWDFGDPASGTADTSSLPNPTHTYTTAGNYNVKLVVSIAGQCTDSITKPLGVYPGFFPGFISNTPLCAGSPIQFTDTSKTNYGVVDSWLWDFGDPASGPSNSSIIPLPTHTYTTAGLYNVTLTVTNSKGCQKTIMNGILINDIPMLSVFPHDSTYCGLDTLQLTGTGTGSFNWTPPFNIIGANTPTPMVYPNVPTTYYASLTNAAGCKSKDSLNVIPKFDLMNDIAGPVNICEEDTVTLTGSSNYINNISWQWSPLGTIESPANSSTRVYPIINTNYTLTTRWGNNCVAFKTHTINVKPLAIPNAGPDALVCTGGQSTAQLNASGGDTYQWTPSTGLNNPTIPNPIASPAVPTMYAVAIGVNGCSKLRTDSVFVNVGALPLLSTLNDTLICNIDTIQISTTGTGSFAWSPNYMISSTTVQSPLVSPDVPTWYHVRLTDAVGCHSDDSVFIDVKTKVTIDAGPDTSICRTDGFLMRTVSDALHYIWIPSTYLNDATLMHPFANPLASVTYHVIGNIGKCQSEDSVAVKVVPYPPAVAGPDINICSGLSTQLNATGGSHYLWAPSTFLNNRLIPNPFCSNPTGNILYTVTVTDTLGCPRAVKASVWVLIYPKVIADAGPRDTSVVDGEPLFLNATGGSTYLWSPNLWLNDPTIANPVAMPKDSIEYVVLATSAFGCRGTDSIKVRFYKLDPDIYVPNAFTPNGDSHNDVLRPFLFGMKKLNYFRVFNRFGQMVFSTDEEGKGWDGNFGGKGQDPATYVWMAEGITYKGQIRKKKGYAVLIR